MKVKRWKKTFHASASKESISDCTYIRQNNTFKSKSISRDKRLSLYNDKRVNSRKIQQFQIYRDTQINIILTDLNGEIESNTIAVRDFNTPLSIMDRTSRQKIN